MLAEFDVRFFAVDTHGNPSLPSSPVTFTVPPPSNSSSKRADVPFHSGWS